MKKLLLLLALLVVSIVETKAQNPSVGDTNRLVYTQNGKIGLYTNGAAAGNGIVFNGTKPVWGVPSVGSGGTVTNTGTIVNNGLVINNGSVTNNGPTITAGPITHNGAVTNNATVVNGAASSISFLSGSAITFHNQYFSVETVTSSANIDLVCTNQTYKQLTLAHNTTFASTARAAGRGFVLKMTASGGARTLAFPAWKFIGAAAPASLADTKTAILSVQFYGTAEGDGVAAYSVEP